nr:protein MGARP isoform X2 [Geotrypetes seraphini]XP_033795231.1 protein MGARP isoform X2 [Geotrypetes seraphini]XP_033795240.1 protein MGARP isoform X2 [Geotrypetes seraphini]
MSSSSVPGSSGESMIYYLIVGVSVAGAGSYIYRTLHSDRARYTDRINCMEERRPQWKARPHAGDEGEEPISADHDEVSKEDVGATPGKAVAVTAEAVLGEAAVETVAVTVLDDPEAAVVEAAEEALGDAVKAVAKEAAEQNQSTATSSEPQGTVIVAKETMETLAVGKVEQDAATRQD